MALAMTTASSGAGRRRGGGPPLLDSLSSACIPGANETARRATPSLAAIAAVALLAVPSLLTGCGAGGCVVPVAKAWVCVAGVAMAGGGGVALFAALAVAALAAATPLATAPLAAAAAERGGTGGMWLVAVAAVWEGGNALPEARLSRVTADSDSRAGRVGVLASGCGEAACCSSC